MEIERVLIKGLIVLATIGTGLIWICLLLLLLRWRFSSVWIDIGGNSWSIRSWSLCLLLSRIDTINLVEPFLEYFNLSFTDISQISLEFLSHLPVEIHYASVGLLPDLNIRILVALDRIFGCLFQVSSLKSARLNKLVEHSKSADLMFCRRTCFLLLLLCSNNVIDKERRTSKVMVCKYHGKTFSLVSYRLISQLVHQLHGDLIHF